MVAPWHVLMLLAIPVFWFAPIGLGALLGNSKGRLAMGLVLGIVLGWIGVIIVACVPPTRAAQIRRERQRQQIAQAVWTGQQPCPPQQPWPQPHQWPSQPTGWRPQQGQQPAPPPQ
jgi:hypothetical protein